MILSKNDEIEIKITGMTSEGGGVGRHGGLAVFVPKTIVDEEVLAHIIKVKKNYAVGKCVKILKASKHRIPSDCEYSKNCGGCAFRHVSYDEELRIKRQRVQDAISKIAGLDITVGEIVPSERTERYRNKVQYPVRHENGELKVGFFAERSHRIVSSYDCLLQNEVFEKAVECFKKWIKENNISVYDEETGRGELRHIYLRRAQKTGQVMACAVINSDSITACESLVSLLKDGVAGLKSVCFNINKKDTNVILGEKCRTIWGSDYIEDELLGTRLRISPQSFYQVNSPSAEKLYSIAREYADIKETDRVVDVYCGIGSIGLSIAKGAKELIGFEIVPEAVQNARENAKLNGFDNAEFFCSDAKDAFKKIKNKGDINVVILDPPRKGCSAELIDDVVSAQPERIVYVSCDSATLARDLKIFAEKGYKTEKITPVDMFPRTHHCEAVCKLLRSD